MLKKIFLFIFIGGIFYLFGAVTVQYKLFPFSEIYKIRSYFQKNTNLLSYSPYYLSKVSQFNELKDSENFSIVMLGDSITDGVSNWNELLQNCEVQNRGISGDISKCWVIFRETRGWLKPSKGPGRSGADDIGGDARWLRTSISTWKLSARTAAISDASATWPATTSNWQTWTAAAPVTGV